MTTNGESPRREAAFYTSIRGWGITRGEHGVVGGVIEGVGDKIGLDRVPARIIAVLLLFMTQGFFFALYAAAWALLPDRSGRIILQDFGRGTPNVGALIVISIFTIIGLSAGPGFRTSTRRLGLAPPRAGLWPLIPLGIAAAVVALVVVLVARHNDGPGPSRHRHASRSRASTPSRPSDARRRGRSPRARPPPRPRRARGPLRDAPPPRRPRRPAFLPAPAPRDRVRRSTS